MTPVEPVAPRHARPPPPEGPTAAAPTLVHRARPPPRPPPAAPPGAPPQPLRSGPGPSLPPAPRGCRPPPPAPPSRPAPPRRAARPSAPRQCTARRPGRRRRHFPPPLSRLCAPLRRRRRYAPTTSASPCLLGDPDGGAGGPPLARAPVTAAARQGALPRGRARSRDGAARTHGDATRGPRRAARTTRAARPQPRHRRPQNPPPPRSPADWARAAGTGDEPTPSENRGAHSFTPLSTRAPPARTPHHAHHTHTLALRKPNLGKKKELTPLSFRDFCQRGPSDPTRGGEGGAAARARRRGRRGGGGDGLVRGVGRTGWKALRGPARPTDVSPGPVDSTVDVPLGPRRRQTSDTTKETV